MPRAIRPLVIASAFALVLVASASSANWKGSEKAHCTVGDVVSKHAADVAGIVIGQHPAWGKTLPPGTRIGLTISLGPS